jgi:tetratricopeptide (TPR) repeat protein
MSSHCFDAAHRAVKVTTLFVIALIFISMGTALAQTGKDSRMAEILEQAKIYQYQFRAGKMDILPEYVALLEEATRAEPDNADLWCAMGTAYLAQAARAFMPGGNPADAMSAMQKGPAALRRALQIDPNHAETLARMGGVQAMMGSFMQAPRMTSNGVAAMNRAVELAPHNTRVRLQRAFSGLSLPDSLRNNAAEAEDLEFLINVAGKSRAIGYVQIMRADLHFELGNSDAARALYKSVATSDSSAATAAKKRLAAMDHGGVPSAEITSLRTAAGAECVMCHGH